MIEQNAPEPVHHERHLTRPQEAETLLAGINQTSLPSGSQSQLACPQFRGQGCNGKHRRTHQRIQARLDHYVRAWTKRDPRYVIWQDRPSGCSKGINSIASAPTNDFATQSVQDSAASCFRLTANLSTMTACQLQKSWQKPITQSCICYVPFQHSAHYAVKKPPPARYCPLQPTRFWT